MFTDLTVYFKKNMFKKILQFFGLGDKENFANLVQEGAKIIDVRTSGEYANGHINGSLNIPVDRLATQLNKLGDKNKVIITCCASGIRSASARSILISKGFTKVYNGGSWPSLQKKLS